MKTPLENQFETEVKRDYDTFDELRADILAVVLIAYIALCLIFV